MVEPGPKLELVEATETTIVVEFQPLSSISTYELQWSEYPQFWQGDNSNNTVRVSTSTSSSTKQRAEATNLNPGSTFALRLVCVQQPSDHHDDDDDNHNKELIGPPGPELIIDTEQVGCTPKPNRGCCTIL